MTEALSSNRDRGALLEKEATGESRKIRLAFVCSGDPLDVLTWSGTPFHMIEALRKEFDIVETIRRPWPGWFTFLRKASRRLSNGKVDVYWWPFFSRIAGARTIDTITKAKADAAFVVAASPLGAELTKLTRVAYVSDATFSLMEDYNLGIRRLGSPLKRWARDSESQCITGAVASFLPSDWARDSAIRDHGGDAKNVFTVPWGSNMPVPDSIPPEQRSRDQWRLLFVGTDWVGKGGEIALETIAEMRRRGHDVHLDIVGSSPPEPRQIEGITFHGFLDKRKPADREKLHQLFRSAHAFFLPTRSEALGIVFAEAASYGLPSVTYRTGGISAMVAEGQTGVLLEEGSPPIAFADALIGLLGDWDTYLRMAHAAPKRSEEVLNWAAWALEVHRQLSPIIQAAAV